ncbi:MULTISPECIES: DUF169 domain-containing protein [Methanobacterium]|uniref:DUF169 domain-containing protein n=1 Tax=Methanobacterium bryantii TaxID=2161 RepID=A0A2A2H4N5_METBR|nr:MULTISPECIES: DUF169 domain-containing protein [Methanobacterium]OEC85635.1 hypothetical protein A9507_13460 [Methanobacterium sp. A39]PAV04348.1 hypothetical protein ASJ80_05745 [Methanobacterium bryantii]
MAESTCEVEGYDMISKELKERLGLDKSPVAIKFVLREEDIPEGIEKIDENIRHCEMVQRAAQGAMFYATNDEQMCKGGASAIGLMEAPEKIKTGEFYQSLGRFSSLGAAKRTLEEIPKIDPMMKAVIYAPLEDIKYSPDVIVIICTPVQAMKLAQAMVYTRGGKVEASFSGIQSICADAVAGPFTKNTANITMGCSGSRGYADIKEDEVIVGMNGENIGCVVNALVSMK